MIDFDFSTLVSRADSTAPVAPVYRALYQRIREAILAGKLAPGSRLPSTRALASQLAMARGTVEAAYELLVAEGFVIGRGAAGSVVNPQLAAPPANPPAASPPAAPPRQATAELPWHSLSFPLQSGLPAFDAFPRKLWSRLAARRARALPSAALGYPDPAGWPPLRQAVASYLAIARGIHCDPAHVFITAGYQGALGLIARLLLRPSDTVWCEDPGYFIARDGLRLAGAGLVPVPVDEHGLDVAAGMRRAPRARLAVVTPSHQSPLGVTLALPRRLALLQWAQDAGAWVVEDDYDSEFRYDGPPLPALKSLDRGERVLYAGSFSKVLFPGLRLGYLVVPDSLVERFAAGCARMSPSQGWLEQGTVADFIEQGHFSRHIRQMRQLYAQRRDALAHALHEHLGERLRVALRSGGMHLLGWLPDGANDGAIAQAARHDHGLAPVPLSPWCIEAALPPGLLLSFTNVPVERAGDIARRLARVPGM